MASEKTVSVRLRLLIDSYQRAARTAAGDTKSLAQTIKGSFAQLNNDVGQLGSSLTRRVTLPLVGLGGGALKLATDFGTAFDQMQTLAGVTANEVDGLQDAVMRLAKESGRGPQELAEALYFAKSAGYDTKTALDIVTKAAKGAEIGLGTAAVVTDAVTNALGTYGTANLSAAEATDILVAAAQVAKLEAKDLAPQLGRLLPTAQLLGVGFADVTGALAFLSQSSGDAAQSATALDGVLRKLLNPSQQGREALAEAFGSAERGMTALRGAVSSGGLPAALDLLRSKFGTNSDALNKLFDDVEAFRGASVLLQDAAGNLQGAFEATKGSAGALDREFKKLSESDAHKLRQDFASLQVTMIRLGGVIAPLAARFGDAFADIVSAFTALPPAAQEVVVWAGLLAAAAGPVMKTWSMVASVVSPAVRLMVGEFKALRAEGASTVRAVASVGTSSILGFGAVAVAIAGAAIILNDYNNKKQRTLALTKLLTDDLLKEAAAADELSSQHLGEDLLRGGLGESLRDAQAFLPILTDTVKNGSTVLEQALADLSIGIDEVEKHLLTAAKSGDPLAQELLRIGRTGKLTSQEFVSLIRLLGSQSGAYRTATRDAQNTGYAIGQVGAKTEAAKPPVVEITNSLYDMGDAAAAAEAQLKGLLDDLSALYAGSFAVLDSAQGVADAFADVDEAARGSGGSVRDLSSEQKALERSTKDVTRAQQDLADAEAALAAARAGATPREKSDAALDVKEAELGVRQAQKAVTDARKRLAEERKKGKDGDLQGAQLDVAGADLALARAKNRLTDAQKAQNLVMRQGEETSKHVTDALGDVQDATDRLVEAQDRQRDAEAALGGSATGGPVGDRNRNLTRTYQSLHREIDQHLRDLASQHAPTDEIVGELDTYARKVQAVADTYGDVNGQLKALLGFLDDAKTRLLDDTFFTRFQLAAAVLGGKYGVEIPNFLGSDASGPTLSGSRAGGGPMIAGRSYLVNERGPEVLTMGSMSGHMTPFEKAMSLPLYAPQGQWSSGGGTQRLEIPLTVKLDGAVLTTTVAKVVLKNGGRLERFSGR